MELTQSSAHPRGWQSQRHAPHPHELTLLLEQPARITQIQILSHECKIPQKVELYTLYPAEGDAMVPENCVVKRLGHLTFNSNERSKHQARELKSVHINTKALLLRLVVHKNYENALNKYNQVGLIAISLIGEPVNPPRVGMPALDFPEPDMPSYGSMRRNVPSMHMSPDIGDYKPRLKPPPLTVSDVDSVTGAKLQEYQLHKQAAIEIEDYDEAKRIKEQMDRLKIAGQQIAELVAMKNAAVQREAYDAAKSYKMEIDNMRAAIDQGQEIAPSMAVQAAAAASGGGGSPYQTTSPQATIDKMETPLPVKPAPAFIEQSDYDERPVQAKGNYGDVDNSTPARFKSTPGGSPSEAPPAEAPEKEPMLEPVGIDLSTPADPNEPEPLSVSDEKDAAQLIEILGERPVRCLYSKNWHLREQGLEEANGTVSGQLPGDPKDSFRALVQKMLLKGLKDRVANVFLATLQVLRTLFEAHGSAIGGRDLQYAVNDMIPTLLERTGETNQRIKEASSECLLFLAEIPDVSGAIFAGPLLKPLKNAKAWKLWVERLNFLEQLIPQFGVVKIGESGFTVEAVMAFITPAFGSANGEVRSAAVRVATELQNIAGSVERFLPKDLKPAIRDMILDGTEPSSRPSAAAAARPKPRSTPAKSKPAARSPAPQKKPAPVANDPVSLHKAEIAKREEMYGENHVEVALSLVDLAVLYNDQGEAEAAVPLYERALTIFENEQGPNSPDVAQTLTDLAVIHIEAGRDDLGRPQLERAKTILEADLGPDHEDVLAIKDVLDNLDADEAE